MGRKMSEALTSMNLGLLSHLLGSGTSPACQDWRSLSETRGRGVGEGPDRYSPRNKILIGETKLAIVVGRAVTLLAMATPRAKIQAEY